MSHALLSTGQLRWWSGEEIEFREDAIRHLSRCIQNSLLGINRAWRFERVEGPTLVPRSMVKEGYTEDDLWTVHGLIEGGEATMRPETTATSYMAARRLIGNGTEKEQGKKLPLCVWQVGRSFRREASDGANAAKLRFFEFTQAEWQCIYGLGTMADYREAVLEPLKAKLGWLCGVSQDEVRIVPSDRLPGYSERTDDVEVLRANGRWTEVCSVSTRTDFEGAKVLEVAVGLDRVVDIAGETGFAVRGS
jgi:glycyl-tRNA synthetase